MKYFLHFLTPFALAIVITTVLIPVWITICRRLRLFDEPDSRKHHGSMTPSMGGIAIFAGLTISFLAFAEISSHFKMQYLFGAMMILFFTGFFDDFMDVAPVKKMLFQSVSALLIYVGGFKVMNLHGIAGIHAIPEYLQLPLTLFLIILFTNAYNFIDGVDGLAGSYGVIASSCCGTLFFLYGKTDFATLSFCLTGALIGFLFFNYAPARIFMGDTGSLIVGFLIAIFSIELLNTGIANPSTAMKPSLLFAIMFLPLFDIARVMVIRMLNGTSLLHADRNHLHHLFLSFGFGHRSTTLMMSVFALLFIFLQVNLEVSVNTFIIFSVFLALLIANSRVIKLIAAARNKLYPGTGNAVKAD